MANEVDVIGSLSHEVTKIDPTGFDVTISALLIGIGAEKYVDIFRKHNIGQCTLMELADEDLVKLGVDDPEVRKNIIEEVRNLPLYEDKAVQLSQTNEDIDLTDMITILEGSSQHLHRIYLSMLANRLALKKSKNVWDCLIYKDKYASDIAVTTLSEITNILNSMDISLHTQMKVLTKDPNTKNRKLLVATVGSAVIAVLTVMFVQSLRQLK